MKFAILAAGEGSRLAHEGIEQPKPLVKINGEAMIDRLIRIFMENDAEEIFVITNNLTKLVQEHLDELISSKIPLKVFVKTTPSSMHSFYELKKHIGNGRFCLTTVDTIFHEHEFASYISEFNASHYDGMMAATDYIDDEKPLYISTDADHIITGFHDSIDLYKQSAAGRSGTSECRYISGGIYCLDSNSFPTLDKCINSGMSRMRNFQRQLVSDGLRLKAYCFSKIIDVDHADDIKKAEELLNSTK